MKDRAASLADIKVCATALEESITKYSGGKVIDRLEDNLGFVKKIDFEFERRAPK